MGHNDAANPPLGWMIDASHNLKDPLEDLIQSLESILVAYAKAQLIDYDALEEAQRTHDVTRAAEVLRYAFETDVRPLVRESRLRSGGAVNPLGTYRTAGVRAARIRERGEKSQATGL